MNCRHFLDTAYFACLILLLCGCESNPIHDAEPLTPSALPDPEFFIADEFPSWSPDGRLIAYAHRKAEGSPPVDLDAVDNLESGVYLIGANGGQPQLLIARQAYNLEPTWAPDGQRLAFSYSERDSTGAVATNIWTVSADGTNLQRLTNENQRLINPAWSPVGDKIAFLRVQPSSSSSRTAAIMIADLSSPEGSIQVLIDNVTSTSSPSWSPDGNKIAYQSEARVWIIDADGGEPAAKTDIEGHGHEFFNLVRAVSWSHDNNEIAYFAGTTENGGNISLKILRLDSTDPAPEAIFEHPKIESRRGLSWPPDDQKLVFSMRVRDTILKNVEGFPGRYEESRLFVINRKGSGIRQLRRGAL